MVVVMLILCGLLIICVTLVLGVWVESGGDLCDLFHKESKDQKEWKIFSKHKPTVSGWYLCTVEQDSRFPMLLYWENIHGKFVDPVRKSVFDKYEVMVTKTLGEDEATDAIMPDNTYMERIYTDDACDRTEWVIAWKEEPRVYMGEIKNLRNVSKDRAN